MALSRPRTYLLYVCCACVASLIGMVALPHDKYLRYQGLNEGTAPTAYWIYERIHEDPAPIDIAFIGTSRTGLSIHSRRLEDDLHQRGIAAKAANLHIVKNGVDMQYVVTKELLEARKVKLLIVEMIDWEDRLSHPDFIFLADPADVISAPIVPNLEYFSHLVRLPGRQLDLFLETEEARLGWTGHTWVPPYEGSNLDHAEFIITLDGVRHDRTETRTRSQMEQLREEQQRNITPPLLPPSMSSIEFRLPRYYMTRILDLAQMHGSKVIFLYTPRYGGPARPRPYEQYASRAPLINPWSQLQDYALWSDDSHLNWEGAKRMTDYVAGWLAARKELHASAAIHSSCYRAKYDKSLM